MSLILYIKKLSIYSLIQPESQQINQNYKSNKIRKMRQKRENFQKEIRREKINNIFRRNRQRYFNFKSDYSPEQIQLVKQFEQNCIHAYNKCAQQLDKAMQNFIIDDLYRGVRQLYQTLWNTIEKSSGFECVRGFIITKWFQYKFDEKIFIITRQINEKANNDHDYNRQQIYRYGVRQLEIVYRYESLISKKDKLDDTFSYLLYALKQLTNDVKSVRKILCITNNLIYSKESFIHRFCFLNSIKNTHENTLFITFQNVGYSMYHNQERLLNKELPQEEINTNFRTIIGFIELWKVFGNQIRYMQSYRQVAAQYEDIQQFNKKHLNQTYEQTLKQYNIGSEIKELRLKMFVKKQIRIVIKKLINQALSYYLIKWPQNKREEANLQDIISAYRIFLQLDFKQSMLSQLQDIVGEFLNLLISKELDTLVKNKIVEFIDIVVYLDKENILTNRLCQHYNLFERVWSYEQPEILKVKLNIVNSLLLCHHGRRSIVKHLNQICISYNQTPLVKQALGFIYNYYYEISFGFLTKDSRSRFNIIMDMYYSLKLQHFTYKDLQIDFYILKKITQNKLRQFKLPKRYQQWKINDNKLEQYHKHQEMCQIKQSPQSRQRKNQIISWTISMYQDFQRQNNPLQMYD